MEQIEEFLHASEYMQSSFAPVHWSSFDITLLYQILLLDVKNLVTYLQNSGEYGKIH